MSKAAIDLTSLRARKARLALRLGTHTFSIGLWLAVILIAGGSLLYSTSYQRLGFIVWGFSLISLMLGLWYRNDLAKLPPHGSSLDERLSVDVLGCLKPHHPLNPKLVWQALKKHWQVIFISNHLLLPANIIEDQLTTNQTDMDAVWQEAIRLADLTQSQLIEPGQVAAALLRTSPAVQAILVQLKSSTDDVQQIALWLGRMLSGIRTAKPYFGGIGRDWANGFIPHLSQYGQNISLSIERSGAHYGWLMESPGVQAIKKSFAQGDSAIALIGEEGVGKSSQVNALAQLLLQDNNDHRLEHRQIISLNPSLILSQAHHSGELERIIITLLEEAIHAGHIILFLDDAQLFFRSGIGSFDITQILLPIVQARALQLVLAMTPRDYQQLKTDNAAFAGLLTPIVLTEPDEAGVMRVLEDTASGLEIRHGVLIAYDALREAYRLSGRYEQEVAYPGKAIRLLEQSLTHTENGVITVVSVQSAIEQTRGVKVGTAAPVEAGQLLHLEEAIHKRMVNQSRAVTVVANALRRARAGVANPKRPIGSFLFLGPTGVGKTELARSIAATYFGAVERMIRLDMSEYQQPGDVSRLLAGGQQEKASLILAIRQQPFSVVLLDELEKAHPNVLNLLLQLLDEGQLTDTDGRSASFKDAIIIATSNAGANIIREQIERDAELASFEKQFINQLITSQQFKPELLNRFDEIVLFRPLTPPELLEVVSLMMSEVNATLANQNITVELTQAAAQKVVETGYDPRLGARPMRRALQSIVEDSIAARILSGQTNPGDHVVLDLPDIDHKLKSS